MAKKKSIVIKPTSEDITVDCSFQQTIIHHVNAFGFCDVIPNVIDAYRNQARRFNKQADKLEQILKGGDT